MKDQLLGPLARALPGVHPGAITALALFAGLGAAGAAWRGAFAVGLVLWLGNRLLDGLDGAVARINGRSSDLGGYLDLVADFVVYGAIPAALALRPGASPELIRAAVLLLAVFYVNAAAWMVPSALLEKRGYGVGARGEPTSVTIPEGLVSGSETVLFFSLFFLLPSHQVALFLLMAALTGITALQRVIWGFREFGSKPAAHPDPEREEGAQVTMAFEMVGEADRRLMENVRPEIWTNPEAEDRYDLVVVGAGTGGLVSAAIGAALGAKVALVERALLGGDCLNYGCVPSKAVIRASRSWVEARDSATRFGGPAVEGGGDFPSVMERMRELRADLSEVDAADRFRSLGVHVFLGEALFDGPESVVVGDTRLRFRRAILATGARAAVPPIPGLSEVSFLTNETVFNLTELPERFLVLGAGPIGCELAQAFARFGSHVTILETADRPVRREEPEASAALRSSLEGDGVAFEGGARVVEVAARGDVKVVTIEQGGGRREVEGDALLVAVGRAPNVDLGLESAGVAYSLRGVEVDDRLRTTNRRIYAVGDVASVYQFTHVADAQARIAVRNALFFGRGKSSDLVIPAATYTSPEIARVGPTVREFGEAGVAVETITIPFHEVDRARLDGDEEGFVQVHVREGKDEILGATIVAPHAGDLIAQMTQAMKLGVGLEKLGDVIFPYPTTAEALRKAADKYRRRRLTPRTRRIFDLFFRVSRFLP